MNIPNIPKGSVEIPDISIKENIAVNAKDTALLITDMQNDFVHPDGALFVPSAPPTIPNIQSLLFKARSAQAPIVFMQDTHLQNDKEEKIWPAHCQIDTWGWNIHSDLEPQNGELKLQKGRYDAFYGTSLEHYLRNVWNVKKLIIVGTVSNICVLHTVGSANLRWLQIIIPADGISALSEFDQALTLHQVANLYYGDIVEQCNDIDFIN
jgi:nicotinamidase-related amidase